jgi:hypothetical protein
MLGWDRGQVEPIYRLCEGRENRMHLMFRREGYSEPLCKNLEDIINEMISKDAKAATGMVSAVRLYSFMVLYKVTTGLLSKHAKEIMNILKELKGILFITDTKGIQQMQILFTIDKINGTSAFDNKKLISFRKY